MTDIPKPTAEDMEIDIAKEYAGVHTLGTGLIMEAVVRVLARRAYHAERERDELREQIDRLAACILRVDLGEPSQSDGACDTAVRMVQRLAALQATLDEVENDYMGEHEHNLNLQHELAALQAKIKDAPRARLLSTGEADSIHKENEHCVGECIPVALVPIEEEPHG